MAWPNEQWRLLREKAPDLQIAEWSRHPHDRVLYERNLSRTGYNPDDVRPEITSWVSPMQWLQYSSPSLPGYQLGYVCALYTPSDLVFRRYDALVDSHMLMDVMSTQQNKYHQGKVIIPKAAVPILRLFDEDHESSESGYAVPVGSIRWTAREESLCCSFLQKQLRTSPHDKKDQLLRATSVYLVTEGYFRNPKRVYTHLWERARHLGSQGAYVSRIKKSKTN